MTPKIYIVASADAWARLTGASGDRHPHFAGGYATILDDGRHLAVAHAFSYAGRFAFEQEDGVHVLPGQHDPGPIGDNHARHLAHVDAKPSETMRDVALRLHALHGPAFHPDV